MALRASRGRIAYRATRIALLAFLLTACAGEAGTPLIPVASSATSVVTGPNALADFARSEIELGDETWNVAVADTPTLRGRGLMEVTELVGVDGMLFVFDGEVSASFYMLNTLIPLDIAFFDSAGDLVDVFTMLPCPSDDEEPCPTYPAAGPFRYALETEVGGFEGLDLQLIVSR